MTKLALFKLLHKMYYSPEQIHEMNDEIGLSCFFFMFYSCDVLILFCEFDVDILSLHMHHNKSLNPPLCLLGAIRQESWSTQDKIHIDLTLLAARKCIAIH